MYIQSPSVGHDVVGRGLGLFARRLFTPCHARSTARAPPPQQLQLNFRPAVGEQRNSHRQLLAGLGGLGKDERDTRFGCVAASSTAAAACSLPRRIRVPKRYMAHTSIILREYLPVWQGHLSHWVSSAGDIPIYVFRYEDMLLRAEEVLR